ncbi:MAG: ATP-grasp domain-containing protein [Pseudomonadota bacterium]
MNVLLTLGRLAKGLELARALARAGHRVVIADPFQWHLVKPSNCVAKTYRVTAPVHNTQAYLEDLRKIVDAEAIDLVIPVSEEALFTSRVGPLLPAHTRLFGPGFDHMARLHDKLAFAERCREIGLSAPETYRADSPEASAMTLRSDYILKPIHGCSGIGVRLSQKGDPLSPEDVNSENLVQTRLYGRQITSFSIVRDGTVLATGLYEGDVYLGTVSVRFKRVDDLPDVFEWIETFAKAETYTGFLSLDFFVPDTGIPHAIECNPRLTSGLHLLNPSAVAAMVTDRPVTDPIYRRTTAFQDAHAALTVAVGSITKPLTYLKLLGKVLTTKDVVFDWRDPLPFFLMTPMSWDTLRQGLFEGIPLADAVTRDILWHGQPSPNVPNSGVEVSLDDALPER